MQKLDGITLARLIDECREEQDQHSLMEAAASEDGNLSRGQLSLYRQSELSLLQVERVEQSSKHIEEARQILDKIQIDKEAFFNRIQEVSSTTEETLNQFDSAKEAMNKELDAAIQKQEQQASKLSATPNPNKLKVLEYEKQMNEFMVQLDKNEKKLEALKDENTRKEFELEPDTDTHKQIEARVLEEQPSAAVLKVEQGIKEFERFQQESAAETEAERLRLLESLELKKLVDMQEAQQELDDINNYEVQEENPQFSDQQEQDTEAFEQFYKEVQELGQAEISALDQKMYKFDEIDKQLATLRQQLKEDGEQEAASE